MPTPDKSKIFIIHGRNLEAAKQMGHFVRSLGLFPINFNDLRAAMGGTPTVAEIVERGMTEAQGVIALFTADEFAGLRTDFRQEHDREEDIMRWQARPNVIFEAGMAFGRDRNRVVFVLLGDPKLFTDVAGVHVLRPTNDPRGDRATLMNTLANGMQCAVTPHSTDWIDAGDLETCVKQLPEMTARDPFGDRGNSPVADSETFSEWQLRKLRLAYPEWASSVQLWLEDLMTSGGQIALMGDPALVSTKAIELRQEMLVATNRVLFLETFSHRILEIERLTSPVGWGDAGRPSTHEANRAWGKRMVDIAVQRLAELNDFKRRITNWLNTGEERPVM